MSIAVSEALPEDVPEQIPDEVFRRHDVRGRYGDTLTLEGARLIGLALGAQARAEGAQRVLLGRDGRLSSPALAEAVTEGLRAGGCDVIDLGLVPTPVLYFATHHYDDAHAGVMVTGSHHPADFNGFKFVLGGNALGGAGLAALRERVRQRRFSEGAGGYEQRDVLPIYLNAMQRRHELSRPMKVVVDCGNGAAAVAAPEALMLMGCDVVPLFLDVDGRFPNHAPDPADPDTLQDLRLTVRDVNADLGLAFDGDGDRLGVVLPDGEVVYPDLLLKAGGAGSPLFFGEECYGFGDATLAAARLLGLLSRHPGPAAEFFAHADL
jgi:phosphomannomutase / phosphoglucomutase